MEDLDDIILQAQRLWGDETVKAIKKKIQKENVIWKSQLYNSIGYDFDTNKGEFDFYMEDYGVFQDDGVKSSYGRGTSDAGYQFRGNWQGMAFHLKQWARSKNINPYAAAYSIQNKGIKPKRFFNDVIEHRLDLLPKAINTAITKHMDAQVERLNRDNN